MAVNAEWNWAMNLTPQQWAKSEDYIIKQVETWRAAGKLTDAQVKIIKDNGAYKKTRAGITPTDKAKSFEVTTVEGSGGLPTAKISDIIPSMPSVSGIFDGITKYAVAIIAGMFLLLLIKR